MTVIAQENDSIRQAQEAYRKAWNKTLIHSDIFIREYTSFLNKAIRDIPPEKALDVAMGEGRDTLFLTRNGWETTGFDITDEALDSARARAARENHKIETVTASREAFEFGSERWGPDCGSLC